MRGYETLGRIVRRRYKLTSSLSRELKRSRRTPILIMRPVTGARREINKEQIEGSNWLLLLKYAEGSKDALCPSSPVGVVKKSMILNLSKLHSQQEAMFASLRDRTKAYIAKFGYCQNQIAEAIGVSESHIADFLSARRGLSDITFAKLEHVLSLSATQRKLQFYKSGNTGPRMCNLQAKGKNLKGQVKFRDSYRDVINETHAAFSKINQDRMEA